MSWVANRPSPSCLTGTLMTLQRVTMNIGRRIMRILVTLVTCSWIYISAAPCKAGEQSHAQAFLLWSLRGARGRSGRCLDLGAFMTLCAYIYFVSGVVFGQWRINYLCCCYFLNCENMDWIFLSFGVLHASPIGEVLGRASLVQIAHLWGYCRWIWPFLV